MVALTFPLYGQKIQFSLGEGVFKMLLANVLKTEEMEE